jgi:hypothetical protein
MTQAQIQYLLAELDTAFSDGITTLYAEDIWMAMEEVSDIVLNSNENIYPDDTIQVYFDETDQILRVREGYYSGGSFVVTRNAAIVPYDQIIGFILTRSNATKSPYKRSASI